MSTDVKKMARPPSLPRVFLNLMSCITTNFKRRNYFLCSLFPSACYPSHSPSLSIAVGCSPQLGRVVKRNFIWQSFHVSRWCAPLFPFSSPPPPRSRSSVASLVMQKLKFFGKVQAPPKVFVLLHTELTC